MGENKEDNKNIPKLIGDNLLRGYTLLANTCEQCHSVPMMRTKQGQEICVACIDTVRHIPSLPEKVDKTSSSTSPKANGLDDKSKEEEYIIISDNNAIAEKGSNKSRKNKKDEKDKKDKEDDNSNKKKNKNKEDKENHTKTTLNTHKQTSQGKNAKGTSHGQRYFVIDTTAALATTSTSASLAIVEHVNKQSDIKTSTKPETIPAKKEAKQTNPHAKTKERMQATIRIATNALNKDLSSLLSPGSDSSNTAPIKSIDEYSMGLDQLKERIKLLRVLITAFKSLGYENGVNYSVETKVMDNLIEVSRCICAAPEENANDVISKRKLIKCVCKLIIIVKDL